MFDPVVASSAWKHGIALDEVLHAYRHPIRAWDLGEGFTMTVGAGWSAALIEVGFINGRDGTVIVHAVVARKKFLR